MKTIFLLSDTYTIKTILLCSSFLFSEDVGKVIILGENCAVDETYKSTGKVKIFIIRDLDECIMCSDIIIVDSSSIPAKTQNYVNKKTKELNKQFFLRKLSSNASSEIAEVNKKYKSIPIIMAVSLGDYSQTSYIEILLTKILVDISAIFDIELTSNTTELLQSINSTGYLNTWISQEVLEVSNNTCPQIFVQCIKMKDMSELNAKADIMENLSPDFVIISSDEDLVNIDYIKQFFRFACSSNLDIIIKSHYHTAVSTYTVYCNRPIPSEEEIVDIESDDLYITLSQRIFEKLSYPLGMIPKA